MRVRFSLLAWRKVLHSGTEDHHVLTLIYLKLFLLCVVFLVEMVAEAFDFTTSGARIVGIAFCSLFVYGMTPDPFSQDDGINLTPRLVGVGLTSLFAIYFFISGALNRTYIQRWTITRLATRTFYEMELQSPMHWYISGMACVGYTLVFALVVRDDWVPMKRVVTNALGSLVGDSGEPVLIPQPNSVTSRAPIPVNASKPLDFSHDEELAVLQVATTTSDQVRQLVEESERRLVERLEAAEPFWPAHEVRSSEDGVLVTSRLLPLRAFARKSNVATFRSPSAEQPAGALAFGRPYYVFGQIPSANTAGPRWMLVGELANTPEGERRWVPEFDCFLWNTRECINIERPLKIYATKSAAETDTLPRDSSYTFTFSEHFRMEPKGSPASGNRLAALPVCRHEEGYWCFMRFVEGEEAFQRCWVKWDGKDPSITVRIRTNRRELDAYLASLRQLMIDLRSQGASSRAKELLMDASLRYVAYAAQWRDVSTPFIKARRLAILRPSGILETPVENTLPYEAIASRFISLLAASERDIWDAQGDAYFLAAELP